MSLISTFLHIFSKEFKNMMWEQFPC